MCSQAAQKTCAESFRREAAQASQLPELESKLATLQCRYAEARTQADGGTALLSAERELARLEADASQVLNVDFT